MATRSSEAVPNEACQPGQVGGTSQDWTGSGLLTGARVRHVPGTGSPWRWFFSGIWLVYLIQPVAQLFHRHDVVWIVGEAVADPQKQNQLLAAFDSIILIQTMKDIKL